MTTILLGNVTIPLEEYIPVSLMDNASRITQRDYLNAIMQVRVSKEVRMALNQVNVNEGDHALNTWVVTGKGVYVGSWSKRLSKFIFKQNHIKLDPTVVSIISERVMKTMAGTLENLVFQFSREQWEAGEFGEATNSCWFDGRSYAYCQKGLLKDERGGAVKFFNADMSNRARCWYFNLDGSLLIFNAYDKLNKLTVLPMARILSLHYGMDYARHDDVTIDTAYVNGKAIYAIGNPPIQRPITLDFALRETKTLPHMEEEPILHIRNNTSCPECGNDSAKTVTTWDGKRACTACTTKCRQCLEPVLYSDIVYSWNGTSLCTRCRDEHFMLCEECDTWHSKSDDECPNCADSFFCASCEETCHGSSITTSNGDVICDDCYSDHYGTCNSCDEIFHDDDMYWIESEDCRVCSTCLNENYFLCTRCGYYAANDHCHSVSNGSYCNGCAEDVLTYCERCEGEEHVDELITVFVNENDELWCQSCVDEHATRCPTCNNIYPDDENHSHEEDNDED